jgi:hypothetical protein
MDNETEDWTMTVYPIRRNVEVGYLTPRCLKTRWKKKDVKLRKNGGMSPRTAITLRRMTT